MKIIRNSNHITCDKCGCVFEFDKSDIRKTTKAHREDIGIILPCYKIVKYHITYVECPICGHQHEISARSSY